MTLTKTLALCIPLAAVLAGCAEKKSPAPPPAPATPPSGTVAEQSVTATATVKKIDLKTRHVTLKGSDGKEFVIVAGPEVQNLAQVKKGDVVTITYKESIAYEVLKPEKAKQPGASASTSVSRAPLGEKPSGTVTDTVTVRVTITGIDKVNETVTLRDAHGNSNVVKVKDPSKLDHVKVGDLVDITYTEALAVKVEKASKK